MRRLLFVAVILSTFLSIGFARAATIPREKKQVIDKLLQVTGYDRTIDATLKYLTKPMLNVMIQSMKKVQPNLSDRALTIIREEVMAVMSSKKSRKLLREEMYPIYSKIFTTRELRELVSFYSSPLGRKVTASTPQIIRASSYAGRIWALQLVPELNRRIRKRLESEKLLPTASNRQINM